MVSPEWLFVDRMGTRGRAGPGRLCAKTGETVTTRAPARRFGWPPAWLATRAFTVPGPGGRALSGSL